jgi:hypothetical protein
MPLTQILGNLSLWASFPGFLLYYLFYSTFEFNDPEGHVTDTTVNTFQHKLTSIFSLNSNVRKCPKLYFFLK